MRLISWNVNGLRACLGKGFIESMRELEPDFICIQGRRRCRKDKLRLIYRNMKEFFCSAQRKRGTLERRFLRKKNHWRSKKLWGSSR